MNLTGSYDAETGTVMANMERSRTIVNDETGTQQTRSNNANVESSQGEVSGKYENSRETTTTDEEGSQTTTTGTVKVEGSTTGNAEASYTKEVVTEGENGSSNSVTNEATLENGEDGLGGSYTNNVGSTVLNADGSTVTTERGITAAASTSGNMEASFNRTQTTTTTNDQGVQTEAVHSRNIQIGSENGSMNVGLGFSNQVVVDGTVQREFSVTGQHDASGTHAQVATSRLNQNGRMHSTRIATDVSSEGDHLGFSLRHDATNTDATTTPEGGKPKKNKSFTFSVSVDSQPRQSTGGIPSGSSGTPSVDDYEMGLTDDYGAYDDVFGADDYDYGADDDLDIKSMPKTRGAIIDDDDDDDGDIGIEYDGFDDEPDNPYDDDVHPVGDEGTPSYDEDTYFDDLANDYDYSNGTGAGNNGTTVKAKAGYAVGNGAIVAETTNLEDSRIGYVQGFQGENNSGNVSAFVDNSATNGTTIGVGASQVSRDDNGNLQNAKAASVTYNPTNGDVTATAGYAAPVRNAKGATVGSMSTYAQYHSNEHSITVGGQLGRVFTKKKPVAQNTPTGEAVVQNDAPTSPTNTPTLAQGLKEDGNDDEVLTSGLSTQDYLSKDESDILSASEGSANLPTGGITDIEDAGSIGTHTLTDQAVVDSELSSATSVGEEEVVTGGLYARAEVGHSADRDPAVVYNVDVQGFVNTSIGGKDATIYGRVASTNGQLQGVGTAYGASGIANPVGRSDVGAVASGSETMDGYRDASLRGGDGGATNTTVIGAGVVVGDPTQQGTNFAGAANAVFEDGSLSQFTAMGRAEQVFTTDGSRQAFGAEARYDLNRNMQSTNFTGQLYYDHTFNDGKTRINSGIGFSHNTMMGQTEQTQFVSFGARQQVAKNVDVYGQYEFGRTRGFGEMGSSNSTYSATRAGVQYHMNRSTVIFGEYNTGYGTAMDGSRMAANSKKSFGAGNFTVGIGLRF